MKYFTRELWLRGQSKDDDVLDTVEAEWHDRCEQYRAYLATVEKEFPQGLKDLRTRFCFHDAVVLNMGRHDHTFVINLQLDTAPYSFVTLTYELVGEPIISHEELPPELQGSGASVWWQYEEVERLPGEPPTWQHSILLSNGWEVQLSFANLHILELEPILPLPRPTLATRSA